MIPIVIGTFLALIGIGVATSHQNPPERPQAPPVYYVPQPAQTPQPITIVVKDGHVERQEQPRPIHLQSYKLVPVEDNEEPKRLCEGDQECEQLGRANLEPGHDGQVLGNGIWVDAP